MPYNTLVHNQTKQMNYKLLLAFLFTELVEFTVFWLISVAIANYFSLGTLSIFLPIVGIDIIVTIVVYGKRIPIFIDALFNQENANE
jgi:F0F1-type ATP synthase assembly protein I